MDPITVSFTFPGFKNLWNCKFSEVAPETTDNTIVFRLSSFNKKFNRETYSPEMTDGKVSSQEVSQALAVFEIAASRAISLFDLIKRLFMKLFLPYIFLEICDMSYFIRGQLIWFLFFAFCAVRIYYLLIDGNQKMERSRAELKSVIELIQPGYLAKGLRWRMPENSFGWLELTKEDVGSVVVEGVEKKGITESAFHQEEGGGVVGKTTIDDSLISYIRD